MTTIKNVLPEWQIERLEKMLERARSVVVTCHLSPDGDAIGSSLALCGVLRRLGKYANVVLPDQLPLNLRFIAEEEIRPVVYSMHPNHASVLVERADIVFCLDYNSMHRIDKLAEVIEPCRAPRILIDHHEDPETELFKLWMSYPEMSSTCELVYRIIVQSGWQRHIDRFVARALYLGLMTDTGNFIHDNSENPELYYIVADLLRYDIDKGELYNRAMNTFTENALRLQGHALSKKMELYPDHRVALIVLTAAELEEYDYHKGDTEGLVNRPLSIPGVTWSVFMREDKRCVKVSMRCEKGFRVDTLCARYFNGGGHELAAGGDFFGSMDDAVAVFHRMLAELPAPVACDGDNDEIFEKLNIKTDIDNEGNKDTDTRHGGDSVDAACGM